MKKIIALLLVMMLITATFAGCAKTAPPQANDNAQAEEPTVPEVTKPDDTALNADIVVIGAGGAGMTAAIQAMQDGATNIVILEKMAITGGNTTRSTGGLNAAATKYQEKADIEDSVELFVKDTMTGGKDLNDPALVQTMAENSAAAVDWVNEIGGDLTVVGQFAGASVMRIHRPTDTSAVGPMLVTALNNKVAELNIPVLLNTKATELIVDDTGVITGVKAEGADGEITINCKAVVLATGGFGANSDMVVGYSPALAGFATTNHSGATGDGIVMATAIGAGLTDIEQIQTHPTVNPDTSDMYTEGVRGNGAMLVNAEGKRFISEMETRDVVSKAILEQTGGYCWLVFDETVRISLKAIETYISMGIIYESDTVAGLAEKINVDPAGLQETFKTYAKYVANKNDEEFGRIDTSMGSDLSTPNFYAGKCAPAVHHTMGGVKINPETQVLTQDGVAIPGLYAAGEITGGVHGANRLGGNAVADIVIFGRIAGTNAQAYVMENGGTTAPTITVEKGGKATPEAAGSFTDGTYTGSGQGNNGPITVKVVVEGGNIISITLTEHMETAGIYNAAEERVIGDIIRTQTIDVDTVSGATHSSQGIMEAVKNALGAA